MIDPNSPGYEAWYQAQLACIRQCEEWRGEIRSQRALRVLVDGTQRVSLSSKGRPYTSRAELAALFNDRGPDLRRFARSATRAELAERILADRLAVIDAEIARLEKLIADNQPSPMWRERKNERERRAAADAHIKEVLMRSAHPTENGLMFDVSCVGEVARLIEREVTARVRYDLTMENLVAVLEHPMANLVALLRWRIQKLQAKPGEEEHDAVVE